MYLTHEERRVIVNASGKKDGSLDVVVRQIHLSNPEAFYTAETLPGRHVP